MEDAAIDPRSNGFASLDDSETFVQNLLATTEAQERIHRNTAEIRNALIITFATHEADGLLKRANRLADCCKWPLVILKNNGLPAISLQRCRDRLCPVCSKIKGMQTTARVQAAVKRMDSKRFVTLTALSTGKTLKECSQQVTASFRELRRSKIWKKHVTAGIWTKEIKPGKKEGTWNVHLHMLVDGSYFPQKDLAAAWFQATGDSMIADIRKVHNDAGAANYVTKYIAKPGNFNRWSEDEIIKYAKATKGDRLLGTFGKLHAADPVDEEQPESEKLSDRSISTHKLIRLASESFPSALTAVQLMARAGGFYAASVCQDATQPGEKISEKDLVSLGLAIADCICEIRRRTALILDPVPAVPDPLLNEETWNQLVLLDVNVGFSYR